MHPKASSAIVLTYRNTDKSVTQVLFQNTIQFQAPQAKKLTEICPNLTHLSISGCHKLQGTININTLSQ